MANAVARVARLSGVGDGSLEITLEVAYAGPEVAGGMDLQPVPVGVLPTDQPAAIRSKLSAAVVRDATERGYTIIATDIILPTFQKG